MSDHAACATAAPTCSPVSRGKDAGASEYTFRASTQIETAAPGLQWLNKGVFISVGAVRLPGLVRDVLAEAAAPRVHLLGRCPPAGGDGGRGLLGHDVRP